MSFKLRDIEFPEGCRQQWDLLLILISSEEKNVDRTSDGEIETMTYFQTNKGVGKVLTDWLSQMNNVYANACECSDTAKKSDPIALYWRTKGNDMFQADHLRKSLNCYTKSVMYADPKGSMYPLAFANRSAVLLRMRKYHDCMADITIALRHGYPEELTPKLLLRRADCLVRLDKLPMARDVLDEAEALAETVNLEPRKMVSFVRQLNELRPKCEKRVDVESEEEVILPELYKGANPKFEHASIAVELHQNETVGRYVVTNQATARGDVLFSEEPYAWVTLLGNVCQYCCTSPINCVPCRTCSRAQYCSEECADLAQKTFHVWECKGMQMTLFETIGIAHLAIRVLIMSATNGFPSLSSNPKTAQDLFKAYSSVDKVAIYHQDTHPFYRMFNLVTNCEKMTNSDYLQYAVTARLLMIYLEEYTEFMPYLSSRLPDSLAKGEANIFAAAFLLRAMGQLIANGHATLSLTTNDDEEDDDDRTVTEEEERRATAIYPSAAMMNHSCDPNIVSTFYNRRLIIRCSRELEAFSEVVNCYGPHKSREAAARRKMLLRAQYMFNCTCVACTDQERKDFVLLFSAYACQSCRGPVVYQAANPKCPHCHAEFNIEKALSTIDKAEDILFQAQCAEEKDVIADMLATALRLRQQVWHRHHSELRTTADKLARVLADLGEFTRSIELIKQNIQSLEYQFGSFSVEVALELRKLADVMLARLVNHPNHPDYREWCLEAHKIVKKSIQLMDLNYGSWSQIVKKLKEKEALVAKLLNESRNPYSMQSIHYNMHYNLKI